MGLFKKKETPQPEAQKTQQTANQVKNQPKIESQKNVERIQPTVKKPKRKGLLGFYDDIITAILKNDNPIEPEVDLSIDQVSLDWGTLTSYKKISSFYIVESYENWVPLQLYDLLRNNTLRGLGSVTMNYYMNITPHNIDWTSASMKRYVKNGQYQSENDTVDRNNVFTQRELYGETQYLETKKNNLIYYDTADLRNHRTIFKTSMFIQIMGTRSRFDEYCRALEQFKKACVVAKVSCVKMTADVFDRIRSYFPTSLRDDININRKTPKQVMTDDSISALFSGQQGVIGETGIPIGLDVYSCLPVLHKFREDKDKAENILITAQSGGGKSVFVKNLLFWLAGYGYKLCILDYEGDEYTSIASTLNEGKPGSAITVDMSAGNGNYFDPLCISSLQMADEEDLSAKAEAIRFTKSMFNVLFKGQMTMKQEDILNEVISRVYAEKVITDNPKTWRRSKKLRIGMVYDTLKRMYNERTAFIDKSGDDSRQIEARDMLLTLKKYFVPGESEYGTFMNALDSEKLWKADCVIFSFGNKGRDNVGADNTKLALKQLCVSKVSNDLSNYNKFVENKMTVKVWEEVQRFIDVPGACEIMKNCITGGRKRGDIAFIVTNNLAELLKVDKTDANMNPEKVAFLQALVSNLQGVCVGYIPDTSTIKKFCEMYHMELFEEDLLTIARETGDSVNKSDDGTITESAFKSSFLVKFNATSKSPPVQTIVKACIHPSLFKNNIFSLGKANLKDLEKEF